MSHFLRITKYELYRLFARRRSWIGFGAFLLFDSLFLIFLSLPKPRRLFKGPLERAGYAFEEYFSGLTMGVTILLLTTVLLGAIYLALVAGDIVAKESEDGNLRMVLSRPVSRLRLLLSKFAACQIYGMALVVFIAASSFVTGSLVSSWGGGLFAMNPELDVFGVFGFGEGAVRYMLGTAVLALSMTVISSVAFLFSCTRMRPAAATIVTISLFFIDLILSRLPYLADYRDWFLGPSISSWALVFRDHIPWAEILGNLAFLGGVSATCFVIGWLIFEQRDLKA